MAQKISVYGSNVFGQTAANQTTVTSGLAATHATIPVSHLYDHSNNQVAQWARQWAIQNGVAIVPLQARLQAEGFVEPNAAAQRFVDIAGPIDLHLFGSGSDVETVSGVAVQNGNKVIKH